MHLGQIYMYKIIMIKLNYHNFNLQDDDIGEIIDAGGRTITVTIMPSFLYDHICKW